MFFWSRLRTFNPVRLPFLRANSSFGQAHPLSHPHLFGSLTGKPGRQVTPGFSLEEYKDRRNKLIDKVLSYSKSRQRLDPGFANVASHLIVIPSARRSYMVEKIPYFFRQDSDFRYFTGIIL